LLIGLDTFCAAYLDDIIIFSDTWEEHLSHLRTVLSRIRAANLTLSPTKCCFAVAEVDYLGHHVGLGRVQPRAKKVQAVLDFPAPNNRRHLQQFLGLAGYYRKFVPILPTFLLPFWTFSRRTLSVFGQLKQSELSWT